MGNYLSHIIIDDKKKLEFIDFLKDLIAENEKFNITSITSIEEGFEKHILDSLSGYSIIVNAIKTLGIENPQIIDIGTGGGFPSTPLMLYDKSLSITQCDSNSKKCQFLLDMQTKYLMNGKVENKNIKELNKKYDIVMTRAFSSIEKFFKIAKNVLNDKSIILFYKGSKDIINQELEEIAKRNYFKNFKKINIYKIDDFDFERNILEIVWEK